MLPALWSDEIERMGKNLMPPGCPIIWMGVTTAHELPTHEACRKECSQYTHLRDSGGQQDFGVAFIANTDTKEKEGEHWVAFYLPSPFHEGRSPNRPRFFDPLGRTPAENGHDDWEMYLSSWSPDGQWEGNNVYIQQVGTNCCGQLCLLWLFYLLGRRVFPFGCGVSDDLIAQHYHHMAYVCDVHGHNRRQLYLHTPLLNLQVEEV